MNWNMFMLDILVKLFVLFFLLPIHEFAHAFVANKLGDNTAKMHGRLTLNPLKHIDPIGALMILLVGIGYAKAVPVNPRNFKNRKRDMALTALAGPLANILMALLLLVGANAITVTSIYSIAYYAQYALVLAAQINIYLAVFNLLPIPPLDGSRIFSAVLPNKWVYYMNLYENQIRIVLLLLLFTGILSYPIQFLSGYLFDGLNWLASLPFRLF